MMRRFEPEAACKPLALARRCARRVAPIAPIAPLALTVLLATLPLQALARCQLQTFNIPVRLQDGRAIATVSLNGTPLQLMVDSGAFFSFLPQSTVTQLKLQTRPLDMKISGYTGAIDATSTKVQTVQIGSAQIHDVEFGVGINELGPGIAGLLGRNFLAMADTEYDLAHGMVRLVVPKGDCADTNLAYWAGSAPVNVLPLEPQWPGDTAPRVTVRINGMNVKAMLDTGAQSTALNLRRARRAGIKESEMLKLGRSGGGGAGHAQAWSAPVALFELGDEKVSNSRFQIDDAGGAQPDQKDNEMLIGIDYFLSHRIYVSKQQGKLYATWNGGPVFALNKADSGAAANADAAKYAAAPQTVADTDADGLARRGQGFASRGDYTRALADLDRAVALAPQSAAYRVARADVHDSLSQQVLALADLDAALRLDPTLHAARLERARLRQQASDAPGALADLQALDAALAPSAGMRASMGIVFDKLARPDDALRQWSQWLQTHAKDAQRGDVLNNRCWMRARLKLELQAALQDCQQAVDADEGNAHFHDSLGWLHLRMNEPRLAIKAFNASIQRSDKAAWSFYGRAQAGRQLGQAAAAQQDLLRARQLRPTIDADVQRDGFEVEPGGAAAPRPAGAASAVSAGAA